MKDIESLPDKNRFEGDSYLDIDWVKLIWIWYYKRYFESLRLPLAKGSSTFLTKPLFPQEREDVAGDAIALPEFWSASGACARKGLAESAYATELRVFGRLAEDFISYDARWSD